MSNHVNWKNEDGRIVGRDPETGEEVAVPFSDVDAESLEAESIDSEEYLQDGEPLDVSDAGFPIEGESWEIVENEEEESLQFNFVGDE